MSQPATDWLNPFRLTQVTSPPYPAYGMAYDDPLDIEYWYYVPHFLYDLLDRASSEDDPEFWEPYYGDILDLYINNYRKTDTPGHQIFNRFITELNSALYSPNMNNYQVDDLIGLYLRGKWDPDYMASIPEVRSQAEQAAADLLREQTEETAADLQQQALDNRNYTYSPPDFNVITNAEHTSPHGMVFINTTSDNTFSVEIPLQYLDFSSLDVEDHYKVKFREF